MTTFHRVFAPAIIALALAAVAQAAPSSSTTSVRSTAYMKGGPVGVTVGGKRVNVHEMCRGLFAAKGFTRCRAGGSRYQATACAWRITPTSGGRHLDDHHRHDRASDAGSASAESVSRNRPLSPRLPRNQGSAPQVTRSHLVP